MKAYKGAILLLAFAPVFAYARKKTTKPELSALFNQAQYVYLQAMDGSEFNPNLLLEDRQAIADVMSAIQGWKRYVLVDERSQADLVFVVREGRLATARGKVEINRGPGSLPGQGPVQPGVRIPGQQGNGTALGVARLVPPVICCGCAPSILPAS